MNLALPTSLKGGFAVLAAVGLAVTGCSGVQSSTGGESGGDYPSGTVEMYVGASAGDPAT